MIKERNLDDTLKSAIRGDVIQMGAEKHYICKAAGTQNAYWQSRVDPFNFHTTITAAHTAMVSGQGDVAYLSCDNHSQASALTWSNNMSHVIGGGYGPARQNMRPRIGHSASMAPMLTVSGYGNTFAGLYFMYGTDAAGDTNLMTVTGNRNSFIGCHFNGPTHATAGDQAGFDLIRLGAAETFFKDCYFGNDTVAWTNGNMIEFQASAEPPRAVFENCYFNMYADNAQVTFLKVIAGCGRASIFFKNCTFLNVGTALTYAIDGTGLGNAKILFDVASTIAGVTDIVAAAYESSVFCGHGGYVSADKLNNLIATNPDES